MASCPTGALPVSMACVECLGKDVKVLCVERNQVFCKSCFGRVFHPVVKDVRKKFTFMELCSNRDNFAALTQLIMMVSMALGAWWCIKQARIGEDYFAGASMCPALSGLRQGLARWDANVFYYYKPSLAFYCDIEDSFWRLLMDGWVRGVVAGSDGFLLLITTLPKAWVFKTAVTTFLGPIYTVIYALVALALTFFIKAEKDAASWLWSHVFHQKAAAAPTSRPAAVVARPTRAVRGIFRLPLQVYASITKPRVAPFVQARSLFWALGFSGLLRLALCYAGLKDFAAVKEVNKWQLVAEPALWFFLAQMVTAVEKKLNASIWKKAKTLPTMPVTFRHLRPYRSMDDVIAFNKIRFGFVYRHYKKQAQDLLHLLVDETFNIVIALRLIGILTKCAPLVRRGLASVGLGDILEEQRKWALQGTGFSESELNPSYLSDSLFAFGLRELGAGATFFSRIFETALDVDGNGALTTEDVFQAEQYMTAAVAYEVVWRLFVLYFFWSLNKLYLGQQAKWAKNHDNVWVGSEDWKTGQYKDMMAKYGSFWNEVSENEWRGLPKPEKKAAAAPAAAAAAAPAAAPAAAAPAAGALDLAAPAAPAAAQPPAAAPAAPAPAPEAEAEEDEAESPAGKSKKRKSKGGKAT